jgi:hypothetical protein
MKRYLLFAGSGSSNALGVNGLVSDFDSAVEAFLSIVDNQTPSAWWHVLDTQTGEVIERLHVRVKDNVLSFAKSERVVGTKTPKVALMPAAKPLGDIEMSIRNVVETSVKPQAQPNGHATGTAA